MRTKRLRVKPRKTVEMPDGQVLSTRAYRTLLTIRKGRWLPVRTYEVRQPKCLRELVDAGYITAMGRVARIVLCYVPNGTEPLRVELYPDDKGRKA